MSSPLEALARDIQERWGLIEMQGNGAVQRNEGWRGERSKSSDVQAGSYNASEKLREVIVLARYPEGAEYRHYFGHHWETTEE